MMAEAPAAINFTVFLNMLAEKLHGTDPEDVILNAFKMFDPEGKGTIPKVNQINSFNYCLPRSSAW